MNVKSCLVLLVLLTSSANSQNEIEDEPQGSSRIVGGQVLQIESVPYMVSIFYKNRHLCGGSIISERYVISAAHCVIDRDAPNYRVRSGSSRKSRGGKMTDVEEVIPHPDYSPQTLNNDFMILKLAEPLDLTGDKQQAIGLPNDDSNNEYYADDEVLASGFGLTQNELESTEFLRGVIVKLIDRTKCIKAYPEFITDNMICAGSQNNQDSCQGDSGGPLESLKTGKLVGITSFGMSCADKEFPGVYSNVKKARDWIRNVTSI